MVEQYNDRLSRAMRAAGVSRAQLASHLKISYQAVRKVLSGGKFGTENNAAAAKFLAVRSDWLATGRGSMRSDVTQAFEWPFSIELQQLVSALEPEDLAYMEVAIWAFLRTPMPQELHYANEGITSAARQAPAAASDAKATQPSAPATVGTFQVPADPRLRKKP